jgi:hypothetical protein
MKKQNKTDCENVAADYEKRIEEVVQKNAKDVPTKLQVMPTRTANYGIREGACQDAFERNA